MEKKFIRKPIANFFIKKDLQIRFTKKIIFTVIVSTAVCLLSLLVVYFIRYNSIVFYQLDMDGNLDKESIVSILLPSLVVSGIVNVVVGVCIGLYASRKYAVPIYKLEQWALLLRKGKLNAMLRFREKEEMKELSDHCNVLTDDLRRRFIEIKARVADLKKAGDNQDVSAIESAVADLELESESIEVHTHFYQLSDGQHGTT